VYVSTLQGLAKKAQRLPSSASPFIPFASKPQKVFLKKYSPDSKAPSHHLASSDPQTRVSLCCFVALLSIDNKWSTIHDLIINLIIN
jgi:hypothetical protein